jgi:hypothetical protein
MKVLTMLNLCCTRYKFMQYEDFTECDDSKKMNGLCPYHEYEYELTTPIHAGQQRKGLLLFGNPQPGSKGARETAT